MSRIGPSSILVCVLAAFATPAVSQLADPTVGAPPILEELAGSYRYAGNAERDHETIERSIEAAISNLGWLGRKIAASRLDNHQELPGRIVIGQQGSNAIVKMGDYRAVAPLDGTKRALVAPNGRDATLAYGFGPNALFQYFVFEQAKRKSTFRFDAEGRLVMSVFMTSEKLAAPIEYDLVYQREAP